MADREYWAMSERIASRVKDWPHSWFIITRHRIPLSVVCRHHIHDAWVKSEIV